MLTINVSADSYEQLRDKVMEMLGLIPLQRPALAPPAPGEPGSRENPLEPIVEQSEPKKRGRKPASTAPAQAVDRGASSEPASPPPGAAPATGEATLAETKAWMQKVAALETETNAGFARVRKIVMAVTNGKQKISDVDPKDYGAIIEACKKELPS